MQEERALNVEVQLWDKSADEGARAIAEVERTEEDEVALHANALDGEGPVTIFASKAAALEISSQLRHEALRDWGSA